MTTITPATLVADIGGTNIRLAILLDGSSQLEHVRVFACADFASPEAAIEQYLADLPQACTTPHRFVLAVPGPVHTEPVTLVNNPWQVSRPALASICASEVILLNDFSAQAWAIAAITPADLTTLRHGNSQPESQPRLILGPGTGLGVSVLLPNQTVLESEAGHTGFAPRSALQDKLVGALRQKQTHISHEDLLSGPGLETLHRVLTGLNGAEASLSAQQITQLARSGDVSCRETVDEFLKILGAFSGDMALAYSATGGVYLSGGMILKLQAFLNPELFFHEFDDKGGFKAFCQGIAVHLVTHPHPGLLGAASFARLAARP